MTVEAVEGDEKVVALPFLRHVMRLEWRGKATCATLPKSLFFDYNSSTPTFKKKDRLEFAISTCEMCPVRSECYEFAVLNNEPHGIWAGTLPKERKKLYDEYVKTGTLKPLPAV